MTSDISYYEGLELEGHLYEPLGRLFEDYDALICPTIAADGLEADNPYIEGPFLVNGVDVKHHILMCMTLPFNLFSRCPVMAVQCQPRKSAVWPRSADVGFAAARSGTLLSLANPSGPSRLQALQLEADVRQLIACGAINADDCGMSVCLIPATAPRIRMTPGLTGATGRSSIAANRGLIDSHQPHAPTAVASFLLNARPDRLSAPC